MPLTRKAASLLFALVLPTLASAQNTGNGFLFGTPNSAFRIRTGWAGADARSDLFKQITGDLTVNRRDYSSMMLGADASFLVKGNTHLMATLELSGMDKDTHFRDFIDNKGNEIEQHNRFRRMPLTLSVKQYITSTGRSIGKFAWIPSRASAYVGAGGGVQWYQFLQEGDFIDSSMAVFHDVFLSDGWAPMAHAFAGVDYTLTPKTALTTEVKYARSHARLSRDFVDFAPIDLSGFSTTVGLTFRF
jgi:outer membrane protein W